MGKVTGFKEFDRAVEPYRPAKKRILDFKEIYTDHDEPLLGTQASRCMNCGVPFCQSGEGCPVYNLIPEWNDLVYNEKWEEAFHRLMKTNNFPEVTGRVCPAVCEGACVLGITETPVAIKNLEFAIADKGIESGWIKANPPKKRTNKKIAIVGSGPAGLSAAQQLNSVGHNVEVYERADRIGGLMMYGIPNMKLDKSIIDMRTEIMEEEGIKFHVNTDVGGTGENSISMEALVNDNDNDYIDAKGKDVIVIGGGDTGNDCLGTSLRHGCKTLTNFEILPELPSERMDNNPWPLFPRIYKVDYGHEESREVFGKDPREYSVSGKEFLRDKNGKLTGIKTVKVDKDFKEIPDTEKIWKADLILLAMGFLGPEHYLNEHLNLELDERSNFKAEHNVHKTSHPKIFAAGDCRRGQSLVVWAINEGRAAAREVDLHLMGATTLE